MQRRVRERDLKYGLVHAGGGGRKGAGADKKFFANLLYGRATTENDEGHPKTQATRVLHK